MYCKITFFNNFCASSTDIGFCRGDTGEQSCWARERAEAFGISILCSVSTFPKTLSANPLSNSAGNGSLAPKSPKESLPRALVAVVLRESRLWAWIDNNLLRWWGWSWRGGERRGRMKEKVKWEVVAMKLSGRWEQRAVTWWAYLVALVRDSALKPVCFLVG